MCPMRAALARAVIFAWSVVLAASKSPTCSLVSTAGELLQQRDGAAIDSADIVVRMGQAPTSHQYAANVGGRTSLRFIKQSFFDTWRHQNKSEMHVQLRHEASEIAYLLTRVHNLDGTCPLYVSAFHSIHAGLPLRCLPNAMLCPGGHHLRQHRRMISGGE